MGTEPCGLPRGGVFASRDESIVATSHGSTLGWRVKLVNHSQPPMITGTPSSATVRANLRSTLTAHLHGSVLTKHRFDTSAFVGRAFDPYSIVTVAEARIVADRHR